MKWRFEFSPRQRARFYRAGWWLTVGLGIASLIKCNAITASW